MGSEPTTSLSIVIVTRNERERIRGCIESVLELRETVEPVESVDPTEVILVDSNSSDGTVDAATEYPITVLQIPTDDLSTPGAGRQVGFEHASGDLVLFVDGDIHVTDGWLEEAIRIVESDPQIAGVDGHLVGTDLGTPDHRDDPETPDHRDDPEPVKHLLAVALYDADAFERVGGFDPWLASIEDIELGYRFRRAGYRLVRLPVVVGSHPESTGYSEIRRRWHNGYTIGDGQGLRKSLDDPRMFVNWLSIYWFSVGSALWLTVGGLLAVLVGGKLRRAWVGLSSGAFGAATMYGGPKWALERALSDLLLLAGIVIGFGKYDPDPGGFPFERVEVVQEAPPNRV